MAKKIKKLDVVEFGKLTFEPYYEDKTGYGCFAYLDDRLLLSCCTNFKQAPEDALAEAVWKACESGVLKGAQAV